MIGVRFAALIMNLFLRSASVLALAAAAIAASADLLVDTTGGTSLLSNSDDGSVVRSLGGTFSFYGQSVNSLSVSANGYLSAQSGPIHVDDETVAQIASNSGSTIAPFFDDLAVKSSNGGSIHELVSSAYYAVSFVESQFSDNSPLRESTFEATLFKSATSLRGNDFLAGDIVLSYGALNSIIDENTFSVGVASSTGGATYPFGSSNGRFGTATQFLSNFDSTNQALLFRYNANTGNYVQSLITYGSAPVPEPSALAALGLGAVALIKRRKRA